MMSWTQIAKARPYAWPLAGHWSVADTSLMAIDMQNDFLAAGGYFASMGEDLSHARRGIGAAERVLATARIAGLTIIHTRESHRPDLSDLNANKRLKAERMGAPIGSFGPMGRLLVRGEAGCDFITPMRPIEGEIVIDKPGNSAFFATDLDQILRAKGARHIILMGVTTDVCVSSTMRDANDRGYDCLLLEDCCGAAAPELHHSVIASLEREGGIFGAFCLSSELLGHIGLVAD